MSFRSRRINLAPSSFGAVSRLEIPIGDKESALGSSGLIYSESQGLIRRYSARDVFSRFIGINKLSSTDDANDKVNEEEKEEELSEADESLPVSENVHEYDSLFEPELGSDVDELEIEAEHSSEGKTRKKRAHSQLYESIVTYKSVKHVLESWVKQGKDLSQAEVSLAIHNLRKRRSYAMSLQVKFYFAKSFLVLTIK